MTQSNASNRRNVHNKRDKNTRKHHDEDPRKLEENRVRVLGRGEEGEEAAKVW